MENQGLGVPMIIRDCGLNKEFIYLVDTDNHSLGYNNLSNSIDIELNPPNYTMDIKSQLN